MQLSRILAGHGGWAMSFTQIGLEDGERCRKRPCEAASRFHEGRQVASF
jgi:hypothetical protein